ncbi:hypothetical protein SU67_25100, partial [Escherichia coli O139:H28 str. E24377A]
SILVTLRPAVKPRCQSASHRVIPERGLAAVLVGQHGDAPGSVIPHAARKTASVTLTGRPRLSYAMVLRLPSGDIVAVRSPAALYS